MTTVIDTSDILLAVPILPSAGVVDFTGGRLTATFTPIFGGLPIVSVASDDLDNSLVFVPAAGDVAAHFLIDMPADRRDPFTVPGSTAAYADVKWHADPARPDRSQWVGRLKILIEPGTDSLGIRQGGRAGIAFRAVQPYDERVESSPLVIGHQGSSGAPRYQLEADNSGSLAISIPDGAYVKVALQHSAALTFAGWPTDGTMGRVTLELDIAAGATITSWPPGTIWAGGNAPHLSAGPAKDVVMFTSIDAGTTIFGHLVGQNYRPAL